MYVKVVFLKEWTPIELMTGDNETLGAVREVSVPVDMIRTKQAATIFSLFLIPAHH